MGLDEKVWIRALPAQGLRGPWVGDSSISGGLAAFGSDAGWMGGLGGGVGRGRRDAAGRRRNRFSAAAAGAPGRFLLQGLRAHAPRGRKIQVCTQP